MFNRLFCSHDYHPYGTGYDDYMRCSKCEHTRDRKTSERLSMDEEQELYYARKQPVSYKCDTTEYMSEFYAKSVIAALVKKEKEKEKTRDFEMEARITILEHRIEELERRVIPWL